MIKDLSSDDLHKLSTVLHDIRQLSFYAKEGDLITYPSYEDLNSPPSAFTLTSEERRFFVFLIQDEGAIKVVHEHSGQFKTPYRWTLKVDNHYLKELNSSVEELYGSRGVALMAENKAEEATPSHAYELTNSDLIESLERQYKNFINLPEKGFFLGIGDYIKFMDENSGFTEIISKIDQFREKDRKKLKDLEEKLMEQS